MLECPEEILTKTEEVAAQTDLRIKKSQDIIAQTDFLVLRTRERIHKSQALLKKIAASTARSPFVNAPLDGSSNFAICEDGG